MISFVKSVLEMDKLYKLLLERKDLIVQDFVESITSNQNFHSFCLEHDGDSIVLSCRSSADPFKAYRLLEVSDCQGLEFETTGHLHLIWNKHSSNLTIDDLLKFEILDEANVVYVVTYEASDEPYRTECRLLGVYNSFAEFQLHTSKDRIDTEDLNVNVVELNALEDIYLSGYQE